MNLKKIQVAIDGPASAGKSTVAKLVANNFSYVYCDTGAMYRSITLKAMRLGYNLSDEIRVVEMLKDTDISFEPNAEQQKVFLDGQEVTNEIRQEDVTNSVSEIASLSGVRSNLVKRQQQIASNGGIVMDGRDIGTTVLPNAEVKIFLIASVQERAERRLKDNAEKNIHVPLDQLKKEIEDRDYKDSHRQISPLVKADDAIEIDTTSMSISDVVNEISKIIKNNG
ncbi:(d)CMP kinase [Apilactobacillus micheneri]|uniref:Cytidylate kinase n=1 Tax=Apilactobacillus micheneri TaxID=1899430 RepID=A0A9Q8INW6_9LACO|nr:(d)CMP kinase [Apilactobacillus micheneri]TPR40679.1 (d)CMP kinase [Apilactobacillus micheneri]TPR42146.1 (d)CMP kinase [Apilactobacillus micheneri]TPR44800.1 (d)CMP kinase [Apilactobacillus micheneri]TPR45100.1 (d)CMP kinase [Apilactobacillus micheneri]TPR46442.1 (d)CMP kinase [Apilactobacillus micheneri]